MIQRVRHRVAPFTLGMILLVVLMALFGLSGVRATPLTPAQAVAQGWTLAEQSGTYHYRSQIDQTTYPAPSLQNAGRAPGEARFGLEGEVDRAAETLEMTLWRDGSFDPQRGIALRVEGSKAYARVGQGAWEEVPNVADTFAPGGDPLGFLAGATNIQAAGQESRSLGDGALTRSYTRYTFELDGAAFGEAMRAHLQAQLQARGQLPPDIRIEPQQIYRHLTGRGTLWLDESGLPARLEIQMELPNPTSGERTQAQITNDYWGYDRQRLVQGAVGFFQDPTMWLAFRLPQRPADWQLLITGGLSVLVALVICLVSLRLWHTRRFYATVVGAVVFSMLLAPLLRSERVYAYTERVETQQAMQATQQAQAQQAVQAQAATQPAWDPHQNPLVPPSGPVAMARAALADLEAQATAFTPAADATDSDGDGLSDIDEEAWHTCPSATSDSAYCGGVADPTDTDGDGLSDGTEVNQLHTLPSRADSDGDTITDTLEVQGFTYNDTTWYLNPNTADTNNDKYSDNAECPAWSAASAAPNPGAICPDSDQDGTPDLFDSDDDNDGVPDDADLSPAMGDSAVYTKADPFTLVVDNLQLNKPVLVTLQFRPQTSKISHQGLVLDWPSSDTEGHIQRRLDTTFATTNNPDLQSTDALAGNGDVRLTPVLEITMPASGGHYANLPVNSSYAGQPRPSGVLADTWLDQDALGLYGIDVQDRDEDSGTLVAYLPLGTDVSEFGDEAMAFNARMLYRPTRGSNGVADWGAAHQFRLLWLVQALQDTCIDANADPATCAREDTLSVVHIYEDQWTLTGLEVSEELGTSVGLLYEDPTIDDNLQLDDHLWASAWNLSTTFLRGRDCDSFDANDLCQSDGNRDVTIANLATSIDGWASNTNYVQVTTFPAADQFLALTRAVTETQNILDSAFANHQGATAPTILMASERTARTINLGDDAATLAGRQLTVNFDPAMVLSVTSVGLNWAPYHAVDGVWTPYEMEDYLTLLDTQVQDDAFFQTSSGATEEEVQGRRLWAQYYYTVLYRGLVALAEIDGETAWVASDANDGVPELTYQITQSDVSLAGLTFIGGDYAAAAITAMQAIGAGRGVSTSIWTAMLDAGNLYGLGKSALLGTALMGGVFLVAVAGLALYAVGYLTGNDTITEVGTWVLTIAAVASLTIWVTTMLVQVAGAVQAATAAAVSISNMVRAVVSVARSFQAFPVVALAIVIGITIAVFLYTFISQKLWNKPIDAFAAIAYVVATILVTILIFALAFIPVVGSIIYTIITIVDAILMLLGHQTMQNWLIEQLADALFDYDAMLKMDDPDRLEFSPTGSQLVDQSLGFAVTNEMTYTLRVSNTMEADEFKNQDWFPDPTEPTAWQAIKYSTFRYFLQPTQTDQHSSLRLYQMEDEWERLSNKRGRTVQTVAGRIPFSLVGTGINEDFGGSMYLTESYAASYVVCFNIPTPIWGSLQSCDWDRYNGSSHLSIGEYVRYDILPTTVTEFVDLHSWNRGQSLQFPVQRDQDGDGLLSQALGGADANDMAHDTDGDGLSDLYESSYGTSLTNPDSDSDGLSDPQELIAMTDPLRSDTDRDGLGDYTELIEGWVYAAYDHTGTLHTTRVWSNPLNTDEDEDTLDDFEEFVFGTHPQIKTDPSFIKNIIRFDNMRVDEQGDLQLLARFEEGAGATVFVDSSGNERNATCDNAAGACPTTGATGRYGAALQFDSTDSLETGTSVTSLAKADFTMAAWVKTTATRVAIITKSDGDTSWELGEKSFYLDANGLPTFVGFGNQYIRSTTAANDGQWHHVAAVWDYSGSGTTGSATMYVDGVDVTAGTTNYAATNDDGATHTLKIGLPNFNANEAPNAFLGTLDEVAVFDTALTAAEVGDLMSGRYNPNDLIVKPGASLTYQATVTNTHATQGSDGLLVATTHYVDPAIPPPGVVFGFEPSEYVMTFANTVGESSTATCLGDGTCPATGMDGRHGKALTFDGVNDTLSLPAIGLAQDEHTIAFWLQVSALPASGQRAYILDTDRTENGALDIYLNDTGKLVFEVAGANKTHVSTFSFSGNLNTWTHVLWSRVHSTFTSLYINAGSSLDSAVSDYTTLPTVLVGPGTVGNNAVGSAPVSASLDELVFYTNQTVQRTTSNPTLFPVEEVYNGRYWIALGVAHDNVSDQVPATVLKFEDVVPPYDLTAFENSRGPNLLCASAATCPLRTADAYLKRAGTFDGVDDFLPFSTNHTAETQDLTFYIKPHTLPPAGNVARILSTDATGNVLQLALDSNGRLLATRNTTTHTSTAAIPTGVWTKVRLRYYLYYSSFWNYDSEFYLNDAFDSRRNYYAQSSRPTITTRVGPGRLGAAMDNTSLFDGSLDEFNVNNLLGISFEVGTFADVSTLNTVSQGRAARCADLFTCPFLTESGRFGSALAFDGSDDFLDMETSVLNLTKADFTLAAWIKTTATGVGILTQNDADSTWESGEKSFYLDASGTPTFVGFANQHIRSTAAVNDGQWHHVAVVWDYSGSGTSGTAKMYVDGQDATAATTNYWANINDVATHTLKLGRPNFNPNEAPNYFSGDLDEVVIIPEATDAAGVALLMATTWPIISVDHDFVGFTAPAMSSTVVSGTAQVSSDAISSRHHLEEEAEAALQFSQDITIPVVDDRAANLLHFLPFEDVPASTLFENIVSSVEQTCSGNTCPVAGLRGQVDRAAFFDGNNDYLEQASGTAGTIATVAAWVKADHGTIIDTTNPSASNYDGVQLDVNSFQLTFQQSSSQFYYYTLPLVLPENEWAHVAGTYDSATKVASVYVNGSVQVTQTLGSTGTGMTPSSLRIGLNKNGVDALHGYLDDLRLYNVALTASEVQALYLKSAAVLRFEFDEEGSATAFWDRSPTAALGQPLSETCISFSLSEIAIDSLSSSGRGLYVYWGGAATFQAASLAAGQSFAPDREWTICGGETLQAGYLESDGSATPVCSMTVSAATITTVATTETGEDYSQTCTDAGDSFTLAGRFNPDVTTRPNPAPGTDGQIGNTALFDGEGAIQIDDAPTVASLSSNFTIMAWISPDQLTGLQQILGTGQDASPDGFSFGLDGETLRFHLPSVATFNSTTLLDANAWQHVAVVFDDTNTAHFYLDGDLMQSVAGNGAIANSDDPLLIGAGKDSSGALVEQFTGQIDELAVYSRALSAAELGSIYLRELRWYRALARATVTVDTDTPTVSLLTTYPYRPDGYIQLAVSAGDARSSVQLVDFGLQRPGESSFTWTNAPQCRDNSFRIGSAWCPAFTSSGEGAYQLRFRAVDRVGNETISDITTLFVDDTPPQVASSYNNTWRTLTADPESKVSWTIDLSGTISDPALPGSIPGSGISTTLPLSITLVDATGKALGTPAQVTYPTGNSWSIAYHALGARPVGRYTIWVTAQDAVGNHSTTTVGSIRLDGRAPVPDLNHWNIPPVVTQTLMLSGTIQEQPEWSGLVARYHFEESSSPRSYDGSYYNHHLTCTNCPPSVAGVFGSALNFDGVDDSLSVAMTDSLNIGPEMTLATWITPDTLAAGRVSRLITFAPDNIMLRIDDTELDFALKLDGSLQHLRVPNVLSTGSYQHIAASYDGQTMRLYHNGMEVGALRVTGSITDSTALTLSSGSSTESFDGKLDEARLYDRALTAAEIYALAQTDVAGTTGVEMALQPFDFRLESNQPLTLTWEAANIAATNTRASSWSKTLPAEMEGFYMLHLRGRDAFANQGELRTVWSGAIDMVAPRVTFNFQHLGSGASAETEYTFTVADLMVDPDRLTHPCQPGDVTYTYHSDTSISNGASASCRVPGHEAGELGVTACDYANHCTTESVMVCGASVYITNGNDSGAGSLRHAIANTCEGGTITFDDDYTISLDSGLSVTKTLTIDGSGHRVVISGDSGNDGSRDVRPFTIAPTAAVTLKALSIVSGTHSVGGALHNAGTLTVVNSTIADSVATTNGGGLWLESGSQTTIVNSTLAANTDIGNGGAIAARGTLTLTNSTLAANAASGVGGGLHNSGTLHLRNTIIAHSAAGADCANTGTLATNSQNLIEDGSCSAALSGDPGLSVLGLYGGQTATFGLLPGSKAIDAGASAACGASPVNSLDQRGSPRPAACDIGAFESQGFTLSIAGGNNQSTLVNSGFPSPLALLVTANVITEPVGAGGLLSLTAPLSGASLSVPSLSAATDGSGNVSASVSANSISGSYTVTVTAAGVTTPATFTLTNMSGCVQGDMDLDNDGHTTIIDIQIAAGAFGSTGSSILGDVNCDGVVAVDDLTLIADTW